MVTVLTESLARRLFPAGDVLGRCVHVREPSSPCREIVGVVRDLHWFLDMPPLYRAYVPLPQAWTTPSRALVPNFLYVRLSDVTTPVDIARLRSTVTTVLGHPEELSIDRLTVMLATATPALAPGRRPVPGTGIVRSSGRCDGYLWTHRLRCRPAHA